MFSKNLIPVWMGITLLSGMFLMGQQTWEPPSFMVPVPAGCFDMGDAFGKGTSDDLPVHRVCITTPFQIDQHEVTNAEYARCVTAGPCTAPSETSSHMRPTYYGDPYYNNFPVIWVDWDQAAAYCTWAGKRLPTEAEWEYAARGGLAGKKYPWGDSISGSDANYYNSGDQWDDDTSPGENYADNGYGLYDVAGNVWEWVSDWYSPTYYQYCVDNGIENDPQGPPTGSYRVLRGGSWGDTSNYLGVAVRSFDDPALGFYDMGFRCVR
jgi:formylglycine-generating enzyme required for sulfatase activity